MDIAIRLLNANVNLDGKECSVTSVRTFAKGGFKSEGTGEFLHLQNKYSKSLSWEENLNT